VLPDATVVMTLAEYLLAPLLPGTDFGDLFELDTSNMEWSELTGMVGGVAPLGRRSLVLAALNSNLFIFGGFNINLGTYQ
jgi:hypothetical protein